MVPGTKCEAAAQSYVSVVLLWYVFAMWTWAQTAAVVADTSSEGAALTCVHFLGVGEAATVVASTTGEGASLAFVPLVGVGSASHCSG